jgi:hypothetical protein
LKPPLLTSTGLPHAVRPLSSLHIPSSNPDLHKLLNDPHVIAELQKIAKTHTRQPLSPNNEKEILKSIEEKIKLELTPMFPHTKIESINLNDITVANIDKHIQLGMKNIASMAISGIEKQIQIEYETFKTPEGEYLPTSIHFKTIDAKIALADVEMEKIKILCQQVKLMISRGESIHSAVTWGMYQAKEYKTIYNTLKWYLLMILALIVSVKKIKDEKCKTESNGNCRLITKLSENLERAIMNPDEIEDPTLDDFPNIGNLYTALKEVVKPEYEQILYQPFFPQNNILSGLVPQYDPNTKLFFTHKIENPSNQPIIYNPQKNVNTGIKPRETRNPNRTHDPIGKRRHEQNDRTQYQDRAW